MNSSSASSLLKVSEITLHYQSKVKASLRPKVTSSEDAYRILHLHWDKNKLELKYSFSGTSQYSNYSLNRTILELKLEK